MNDLDNACEHIWEKMEETHDTGENILGKEVTCWGWGLKCTQCSTESWKRNNELTEAEEQEENDRLWSKVL